MGSLPPEIQEQLARLHAEAEAVRPVNGDTVYIIGAGLNKVVVEADRERRPPLSRDFFAVAAGAPERYLRAGGEPGIPELREWVQRRFGVDPFTEGARGPHIECCMNVIDSEIAAAPDSEKSRLYGIRGRLFHLLAEVLEEFQGPALLSRPLEEFARLILFDRADTITFNYDTYLESAIQNVSGMVEGGHGAAYDRMRSYKARETEWIESGRAHSEPEPELLAGFRFTNWHAPMHYGVVFDNVVQDVPGSDYTLPSSVHYSALPMRPPWFLKPHGSLNWFVYDADWYSSLPGMGAFSNDPNPELEGQSVLVRPTFRWGWGGPIQSGRMLRPLVIPPAKLDKEKLSHRPPFSGVFERARESLRACRKIVTVGYSFGDKRPTSDLWSEMDPGRLERLSVIGHNESKTSEIAGLLGFNGKPEFYMGLESYLQARRLDPQIRFGPPYGLAI